MAEEAPVPATPARQAVVLDTNVVLDWLHFRDPGMAAIVAALTRGELELLTSAACTEELRLVLAYPQFGIAAEAQQAMLAEYRRLARNITVPEPGAESLQGLPRCRDPDDQKFLELACHARAWLITKDKALLQLARRAERLGGLRIGMPGSLLN